jgi:lysophospholipid acyltransferase (LPLAT)-like uncharacterized protein
MRTSRRRFSVSAKQGLRRLRFLLLEKVLLPVAIPALRLLLRTWRVEQPGAAALEEIARAPRVVFATFHGMLLHLLRFGHLPAAYGRRMIVMLSPSLDGRLLAAALAAFGVHHVYATSSRRGVGGAIEFIRCVQAGDMGLIAVDGPRGPCGVAKRGFLQIAAAADAQVVLATTSGAPGIRFGSWDRAHLPLPFARVQLALRKLPRAEAIDGDRALAAAQAALVDAARVLRSPVLPPSLRSS